MVMMDANMSPALIILLFCLMTWIGIQHLGYVEFGVAGRMFIEGAFRRLLNSHISIDTLEESLVAASSLDDCWDVLRRGYREFGFSRIEMQIAGRKFSAHSEPQPLQSWKVTVPISDESYVELHRGFGLAPQQQVVALFVDLLRQVLQPKVAFFERIPPQREHGLHLSASLGG